MKSSLLLHAPSPMDCGDGKKLEPVADVLAALLAWATPLEATEALPLDSVVGRIAADDITSRMALPPFDNTAMDGYGVSVPDIARGMPGVLRLVSRVAAGDSASRPTGAGETVRLLTGAPIPEGVAAVVPEERCRVWRNTVIIDQPVRDGANIRRRGEDVGEGDVIVERGTVLDARHLAILAASGSATVAVRERVRVALLSTGNELRDPSESLELGLIHDANRPMLGAILAKPWIEVNDCGIAPDEPRTLSARIEAALADADLVITSGGARGSDEDHVGPAIVRLGGEVRRHSLALKPGKPLIVGRVGKKIVLALPGNPVAALVNFILFARPLLAALAGAKAVRQSHQIAVCAAPFAHAPGRAEFMPAAIVGRDDFGRVLVEKLVKGGSARLRPLVLADGLIEIPADAGDVHAGAPVAFHPFRCGSFL
jgi:molybdopterin molybdotransferase